MGMSTKKPDERGEVKHLDRIAQFSETEIDNFFNSIFWQAVVLPDLQEWLEEARLSMEDAPKENVHGTDEKGMFGRLVTGVERWQGEISRLRQMIALPDEYKRDLAMAKEEIEDARRKEEG